MRWIALTTLMMESFPDEGDDPSGRENPSSNDPELDKKIPAKKPVAKRPKRTRRPPAIPWKKPKDMPKRPLSAYNLFFQHERQRILSEAQEQDAKSQEAEKTQQSAVSHKIGEMEDSMVIETSHGEASRRHLKSSGIGFANLGKAIGAKWKDLDPLLKAPFEVQAAKEKERYDKEISDWRAQKKLEKAAAESEEDSSQLSRRSFVLSDTYSDISQYSTQGSQMEPYPSSWFQISPNTDQVPGQAQLGFPRSHPTLREGMDDHRLQQLSVAAPLPVYSNLYLQRRQSLPGTMNVHTSEELDGPLHARRFSAPYFQSGTFATEPFYSQHPPSPDSMEDIVHNNPLPMEEQLIQPHPVALAEFSVLYSTPSTSDTDKSSPGSTTAQQEMVGEVRTVGQLARTMPPTAAGDRSRSHSGTTHPSMIALSSSLDQDEVDFLINLPFEEDTP
jgi:hypothetical protein